VDQTKCRYYYRLSTATQGELTATLTQFETYRRVQHETLNVLHNVSLDARTVFVESGGVLSHINNPFARSLFYHTKFNMIMISTSLTQSSEPVRIFM
jgi:hypothetical protein